MLFDNSDSSVKRGALIVFTMAVFFVGATEFMLSSMLRPLAQAFDTSTTKASWLIASYAISYAIAAPIFGYISDRVDRTRLLLIALCAFAIDGAAIVLAPSFEVAVVLRIFGGLASAIIIPTTFALIAEIIPRNHQATAGLCHRVLSTQPYEIIFSDLLFRHSDCVTTLVT
ncbi:MFS transporter [Endozoicomonas sp. SESOKO3]|nr:MFS transporter [Endozoicomonas sp. SESOKO3]